LAGADASATSDGLVGAVGAAGEGMNQPTTLAPSHHVVVAGAAGFIGSAFARNYLTWHPDARVTVVDKLTYAGNLENLVAVEDNPRFRFVQADICDFDAVAPIIAEADGVVNFAAESHVDRSIYDPDVFVRTNV